MILSICYNAQHTFPQTVPLCFVQDGEALGTQKMERLMTGCFVRRWTGVVLVCLVSLWLTSCTTMRFQLHNASADKPSNVALYFAVEKSNGDPLPGLDAKSFKIYEDGQLISPFESKQTILNPEVSVVHYVLVLLDMSGSITESGTLPTLTSAATAFADRITKSFKVAVYGFDGREDIVRGVGFTSSPRVVKSALTRMARRKAKDPSTNLNGALVKAAELLQKKMSTAKQPLRFGTIVVFSDGMDRAHRVKEHQMLRTLDKSGLNVFAIGMGAELSENRLARIGLTGYIKATDQSKIRSAFGQVAKFIEASSKKYYLLSYCSPSRAGTHLLRVEAKVKGMGSSVSYKFNADGFGPNCNPKRKPNFKVGNVRMRPAGRLRIKLNTPNP